MSSSPDQLRGRAPWRGQEDGCGIHDGQGRIRAPTNNDHKFGYLRGLDGWRAVAIVSVILYHSTLHKAGIFSTSWAQRFGYLGVDVFFAISGLLITSKLLQEEKSSHRISLPNFYLEERFASCRPQSSISHPLLC